MSQDNPLRVCLRKNTTHPKPPPRPPRPPSLPPTLSIQPPSSPTVLEQSQAWVLTAPPTSRTSRPTTLKPSRRNLDTQTTRSDTLFVLSSQSLSVTIISDSMTDSEMIIRRQCWIWSMVFSISSPSSPHWRFNVRIHLFPHCVESEELGRVAYV